MQAYGWMTYVASEPPNIRYFSFAGKCGQRLYLTVHDRVEVRLPSAYSTNGVVLLNSLAYVEYNHCLTNYYSTKADPRTFINDGGVKPECSDCLINIAEKLYESYLLSKGPLEENRP
jgi:hypothetical protein